MKRFLCLLFVFGLICNAQSPLDSIHEKYKERSLIPVEVVHLHINKSAYVAGEDLAFGAYVLERNSKLPSVLTKNLYVIIEDTKGNRIHGKLFKVTNGFASGVITLDTEISLGYYKVRAYTNFMRNQKDPNVFETTIKILDPTVKTTVQSDQIMDPVVQFIPESGNLISGIPNTVALISKNENRSFEITDGAILEDGQPIKSIKTSKSGLGRVVFIPKYGSVYQSKINWNGIEYLFELPFVDKEGLTVSVSQSNDKALVIIKTNDHSIKLFKDKSLLMALHDGGNIKAIPLNLIKKTTTLAVDKKDISPGVNYITLFENSINPIAERAFFNKNGISQLNISKKELAVDYDSLKIGLTLNELDRKSSDSLNFFTVSVLPLSSKAFNPNLNLKSTFHISPYASGYVDNPTSLLQNGSRLSDFELDNLMIGQVKSINDWNKIFNGKIRFNYSFEQGLTVNVLKDTKQDRSLMIYPLAQSNAQSVQLNKGEEVAFNQIYAQEDEKLGISLIGDKGQFIRPDLKYQLFPNKIPPLETQQKFNDFDVPNLYVNTDKPLVNADAQRLDEVLLIANKEKERKDSIVSRAMGRVDVLTDEDRIKIPSLTNYLNKLPYEAFITEEGKFTVVDRRMSRSDPTFVVDNILLNDAEFLLNIEMSIIDYIEIDTNGIFNGRNFGGDVVKIFTDPNLRNTYDKNVQTIKFPLAFAVDKKYHQPLYASYDDEFFQRVGSLGWVSLRNKVKDNKIQFSVPYRGMNEVMIVIEGMTGSGKLISETFNLSIND